MPIGEFSFDKMRKNKDNAVSFLKKLNVFNLKMVLSIILCPAECCDLLY